MDDEQAQVIGKRQQVARVREISCACVCIGGHWPKAKRIRVATAAANVQVVAAKYCTQRRCWNKLSSSSTSALCMPLALAAASADTSDTAHWLL